MKIFRKKRFWVLFGLFCIIVAGSVFSFLRFREAHYFGKVSEVKETSFLIQDKKTGSREIWTDDQTRIREGRGVRSAVLPGENVIVIGSKDLEGKITAKEIRIFKEPIKQ